MIRGSLGLPELFPDFIGLVIEHTPSCIRPLYDNVYIVIYDWLVHNTILYNTQYRYSTVLIAY